MASVLVGLDLSSNSLYDGETVTQCHSATVYCVAIWRAGSSSLIHCVTVRQSYCFTVLFGGKVAGLVLAAFVGYIPGRGDCSRVLLSLAAELRNTSSRCWGHLQLDRSFAGLVLAALVGQACGPGLII